MVKVQVCVLLLKPEVQVSVDVYFFTAVFWWSVLLTLQIQVSCSQHTEKWTFHLLYLCCMSLFDWTITVFSWLLLILINRFCYQFIEFIMLYSLTYLGNRQPQIFSHLPGVHQSVKLILQLLELLFPLAHFVSLQLFPLGSLCCSHRNWVRYRPLLRVAAAGGGGPVWSGCTACSVGGGSGCVVAVTHTGQTGVAVDGCAAAAADAAVLQAEGLKAHLVVLSQDGPHLQAMVKGACHMEGHNAGGHGALKDEDKWKQV